MPCPVCIIDGFVIASCRFLGVPDTITAYFIGIITLSFALITVKWLKGYFKMEKAPKYTLLLILLLYTTLTLLAMDYIGMI